MDEVVPRAIALDVHYIIFNRKERGVSLHRCVLVIPMPFKAATVSLRTRKPLTHVTMVSAPPDRSPIEWLKYGLESNRHTKIGWLRDLLLHHNFLKQDDKESLWQRVLSDYACQLSYLEGLQGGLGDTYKDPRDYKGHRGQDTGGRYVSKKTGKNQGVPKNVHTIPYLMMAYEVSKCTFKRRLRQKKWECPSLTTLLQNVKAYR